MAQFKMMPVIEMVGGTGTEIVINLDWIETVYPRWETRIRDGDEPLHEREETVELATVKLRDTGDGGGNTYCFAGDMDAFMEWVNAD